ncbi:MAG TPA: hypothetical protein VJ227_04385 [Patescibacteria group bacterium]|nr:hypothetical protein [Patescibacteria group bacterium]
MNVKKLVIGAAAGVLMLASSILPTLATSPFVADLSSNNWRVFNINANEAKLWDINKAPSLEAGLGFTFNTLSTGWYSVYLNTNYGDLSDKSTIIANASWANSTDYVNRNGTPDGAFFRLYFQAAQGNYTSNDYWWNTAYLDLNEVSSGILEGDLNNRTQWTNLCGQSANDFVAHPGPNCVGGTDPAVSPADGFDNAKRNVKNVGLSFGRASRYASGVSINSETPASFQLNSFTVNP